MTLPNFYWRMERVWRYIRHYQRYYCRIAVRLPNARSGGDLQVFTPFFFLRIADDSTWWNCPGSLMYGLGSGVELDWSPTWIGPNGAVGGLLYRKHKQWRMAFRSMRDELERRNHDLATV